MASWFNPNGGGGGDGGGGSTTTQQHQQHQSSSSSSTPIIIRGRYVNGPSSLLAPASIYNNTTTTPNYGGNNQHHHHHQQQEQSSKPKFPANIFGNNTNNNTGAVVADSMRQEVPPRVYRDVVWAILFYIHLAGMVVLTILYAPVAFNDAVSNYAANSGQRRLVYYSPRPNDRLLEQDASNTNNEYNGNGSGDYSSSSTSSISLDPSIVITVIAIAGILGLISATVSMGVMIRFAEPLVKMALFFNIITFGFMAVVSLLGGAIVGTIMFGILCAISVWYTYCVWDRIPFAASNLVTAVTAVKSNMGLAFYSYLSLIIVFGWSILWTIGAGSTIFVLAGCDTANATCDNQINPFILFVFFLSFYWTVQVIMNVVHVTTAGTVGTWWFTPLEANGCCSSAVRDSYVRSLTTSFGSICLGSLLVAIIQAVKEMVHQMREDGDQILLCIAECIIGCIENLIEYFNKWAFVYVGLYGFSFMEAGSNVITMFRNRGWTTIIADSMVDTVLFMVAVGVGAVTALATVLVVSIITIGQNNSAAALGITAALGFFVGYSMVATLLSVVSSAVNTVIVLYAEAPNEFQANHPELSNRMRESWRQAWPNDFNY